MCPKHLVICLPCVFFLSFFLLIILHESDASMAWISSQKSIKRKRALSRHELRGCINSQYVKKRNKHNFEL